MAKRNKEFELKFTGSPGNIAALPDSLFFSALNRGKGEWESFTTTYYDAPDEALLRSGLSLSVRDEAGRLIQTVKHSNNVGATSAHEEFTVPLGHIANFPAATSDLEIDQQIMAAVLALKPLVRIIVDRWVTLVLFRSSEIEVSIDLGRSEVWQPDKGEAGTNFETPLAEVGLALKSGTPADVFDLGRLLARNAPLRLCSRSKPETFLAISRVGFNELPPREKIKAGHDEPAADVVQRALAQTAFRLVGLLPVLVDSRKAEAVHQMRVTLRRLRVLERICRPHLRSRHMSKIAFRAKLIARQLGLVRDWDVFLGETIPLALRNNSAISDTTRLLQTAQKRRAEAWSTAVATINHEDFTVFLIDLMEMAVVAPWRVGAKKSLSIRVADFAPNALDRSLKKTKAAFDNSQLDCPSDLHRVRLALKKHRYSLQMFRALYPKAQRKAYMKDLSALQGLFGTVNDADVGQKLVNGAATGNGDEAMHAAGFICGYKAAQAEAAAANILVRMPQFMSIEPFWRD